MAQPTHDPTLIVLVGSLGDLFQKKLLQALWNTRLEFLDRGETRPFHVLSTDVRDFPPDTQNFRAFLEAAGHRNVRNSGVSGWKEFLDDDFEFVKSGRDVEQSRELFARIKAYKERHPNAPVVFYLSIPYSSNIPVLKQIRHYLRGVEWSRDIYVVLEKPAEVTVEAVRKIKSLCIECAIPPENVGIVEHFVLKHGYRQFLRWAYEDPTHREVLKGDYLAKVTVKVTERIGTEGRAYDGILVDSALNHGAALLASVLGNPWDNGFDKLRTSLPPRLKRLYFEVPTDGSMREEVARQRYDEFESKLKRRGAYGICIEDHCGPDRTVPTGLLIRCNPTTNRLNGSTLLEYQHQKNAPIKYTGIGFTFKNGNGSPTVYWDFMIDGEEPETQARIWGFKKSSNALLSSDERDRRRLIESHYESVPDRFVDGYPHVIAAITGFGQPDRRPKMNELMGLDFQENSILALEGTAKVLDSTDRRIHFHKGQDPFWNIREEALLGLKAPFIFR